MSKEQPSLSLDVMILFEFGLVAVALAVGWFLGFDPLQTIERGVEAAPRNLWHMAIGAALALPVLVFFLTLDKFAAKLMEPIHDVLVQTVAPAMADGGWAGRAVVSLGAGVGEEILFRGLLQDGLQIHWGFLPALFFASVLFGLVHWVNTTYFIFATAIGLVLGLVFHWTGSLVAPIALHAVYDFLALERLVREFRQEESEETV